jgi:hypothetical protein
MKLPRIVRVRQSFEPTPAVDIAATIEAEFEKLRPSILRGRRIAVGVGSRGITNLLAIVVAVLEQLRNSGAEPFIIPAMGSHGGATPEGQRELLGSYGITEQACGVPIRDSLDVRQIATTSDGVPVHCSVEALAADGILLVNRIKPHTDFFGGLGSGLLKMSVIGLGKRTGASTMHLAATQLGYEHVLRSMAGAMIRNTPMLGGIAILENQFHDTARLVAIPRDEMETAEDALLVQARAWMPLLPFDEIDLLIVDAMGKNISGAGMDPNIIHRSVHGYSSLLMREATTKPFIRRIFVRGLTPESHGNAIGIGMADATTTRLVRSMDSRVTNINALTSLTPQCAKIPIAFDTDREAIERLLATLPITDMSSARVVRIADTLSVAEMEISETLWKTSKKTANLGMLNEVREIEFDAQGNLL